MSKLGGTQDNLYLLEYYDQLKRIAIELFNTSGNSQLLGVTGLSIEPDKWYHLVVSVDSQMPAGQNNAWMYLTKEGQADVDLIGSFEWAPPDNSGGEDRAMNYNNNGWFQLCAGESGFGFDGLLDDSRFYKYRSLTHIDVQALYDLAPPADCEAAIVKGYRSEGDFNNNCRVDMADFAEFASMWLDCIDPDDGNCSRPWE